MTGAALPTVKRVRASDHDVGTVYFLANMAQSTVKVGYTTNLRKRLDVLRTGNHDRLEVCCFIAAPPVVERRLHEALAEFKIRNEWFEHNACLDDLIRKLEDYEIERGLNGGNFSPMIDAAALQVVLDRWVRDRKEAANEHT